ncbi:hypothetical protein B0H16DRAFT_1538147, partial [Mycena metata]
TAARVLCFLRLLHARRAGLGHLPPGKVVARVAFLCSMSSRNNCWRARSSASWGQARSLTRIDDRKFSMSRRHPLMPDPMAMRWYGVDSP